MAKSLKNYPITFGYLATTTINGRPYTHRGEDRSCPVGTPIIIEGKKIGLTGNTGLSTGPHCHFQAGTDFQVQNTVKPTNYWFKGGKVVNRRTTDSGSWGKFITLKVGNRYVTYAHLSRVDVKIGDTIKKEATVSRLNRNESIWLWRVVRFKHSPTDYEKQAWTKTDLTTRLKREYKTAGFKKRKIAVQNYDRVIKERNEARNKLKKANQSIATLQAQVKKLGEQPEATTIEVGQDTRSWITKLIDKILGR